MEHSYHPQKFPVPLSHHPSLSNRWSTFFDSIPAASPGSVCPGNHTDRALSVLCSESSVVWVVSHAGWELTGPGCSYSPSCLVTSWRWLDFGQGRSIYTRAMSKSYQSGTFFPPEKPVGEHSGHVMEYSDLFPHRCSGHISRKLRSTVASVFPALLTPHCPRSPKSSGSLSFQRHHRDTDKGRL